MQRDEIRDDITGFIYAKFPLARKRGISADHPLLESGIVDSMGILEIVTHIEETYHLQLTDEEVLADTFQSIASISELIASKLEETES